MATTLPKVDAVLVGGGWTGAIMGKELAAAGLKVVVLERGPARWTVPDFQPPAMHDELSYGVRQGLNQDNSKETYTFRNNMDQTALPMRRWTAFTPGDGLGGAGAHWSGAYYRFDEVEFKLRSHYTGRYGARIFQDDITATDWPVSYAELEPHYDRFEYLCGISGKAGNLKGKIQPGGNPFESARSREFPLPPMRVPYASAMFGKAAAELGYHPFVQPSANLSAPYVNNEGISMGACMYCGFCSNFGCEHFAKSSPQVCVLPAAMKLPGFELRTNAHVLRVTTSADKRSATGVSYIDAAGQEVEQPAAMVFLGAFAINNARLLLLSGIGRPYDSRTGEGGVGRNFTYQTTSSVGLFFKEDVHLNPFIGAGALAVTMDDFNSDNFDHGPHGFVGGAYIQVQVTGGAPIRFRPVPRGTPAWGLDWKKATRRYYSHAMPIQITGASMPSRGSFVDLDPTYRDAYGLPLLRMTFDFTDNDIKLSHFMTEKAAAIGRAMGAEIVEPAPRTKPFSTLPYQTTHLTGGTPIGIDPKTSAANRYGQVWDMPNVFLMGSSVFPQNAAYNPTGTIGAFTYFVARAVTQQYVSRPGRLMG